MRVLMLGWEFPPHISGGLGTACYGITRGLREKGTEIVFILPSLKTRLQENDSFLRSASGVPITRGLRQAVDRIRKEWEYKDLPGMTMHPIESCLTPYGPFDFGSRSVDPELLDASLQTVEEISHFHGGYKSDLMDEVERFTSAATAVILEEHRKKPADVIHAHDWMTYPAAIAASRLCGIPLVLHLHATEYDRCGEIGYGKIYRIEHEGLHAADHVIAVSNRTKKIAMERYCVPANKISVVYNGVFPLEKPPVFEIPRLVRHEKRVLFMARVAMQKGPDYFVEAARLVLDALPETRFILAGNGDLLPRMVRRAAELRMGSRFHFPGFMRGEDVRHMYAISSLYVMPSVSEPFGIAPLEALQCGVPVLMSKQSGSSEVLPSAFTVDFWNIREMADTIINILRYPEMASASLRLCQQELKLLTWDRAAEGILGAYARVCPNARS